MRSTKDKCKSTTDLVIPTIGLKPCTSTSTIDTKKPAIDLSLSTSTSTIDKKKSTIDTRKSAIDLGRITKDLQKTTMRSTIDLNRTTIVLEQKLKAKEGTAIDHKLYKDSTIETSLRNPKGGLIYQIHRTETRYIARENNKNRYKKSINLKKILIDQNTDISIPKPTKN